MGAIVGAWKVIPAHPEEPHHILALQGFPLCPFRPSQWPGPSFSEELFPNSCGLGSLFTESPTIQETDPHLNG